MLQSPITMGSLHVDQDASECRCPGYIQEDCEAEAAQGCVWSNAGNSDSHWCQCLNEPEPSPRADDPEPEVKGPCSDYFGNVEGGIVTVADPDVGHTDASAGYCESNGMSTPCIYMHLAGPANECQSPAPPDGCHRYHTVRYSECAGLQNFNFNARIDTTGAFNTDGVFIECADQVISNEIACYGPPDDLPQACECPEDEPEPDEEVPWIQNWDFEGMASDGADSLTENTWIHFSNDGNSGLSNSHIAAWQTSEPGAGLSHPSDNEVAQGQNVLFINYGGYVYQDLARSFSPGMTIDIEAAVGGIHEDGDGGYRMGLYTEDGELVQEVVAGENGAPDSADTGRNYVITHLQFSADDHPNAVGQRLQLRLAQSEFDQMGAFSQSHYHYIRITEVAPAE